MCNTNWSILWDREKKSYWWWVMNFWGNFPDAATDISLRKLHKSFFLFFSPDVWKYFSHQFFAEKNVEWLAWISQVPFFISKEQLQLLKWDFLSCRSQTSALGQQFFHSSNSTKEVPTCVETFWVWYKFRHRTFSLGVWSIAVTSWSQPQIADHDLL